MCRSERPPRPTGPTRPQQSPSTLLPLAGPARHHRQHSQECQGRSDRPTRPETPPSGDRLQQKKAVAEIGQSGGTGVGKYHLKTRMLGTGAMSTEQPEVCNGPQKSKHSPSCNVEQCTLLDDDRGREENEEVGRGNDKLLANDMHRHVDKLSTGDKLEMLDKECLANMPRSPEQCIDVKHGENVDGGKTGNTITIAQGDEHDKPCSDKPSKKYLKAEVTQCSHVRDALAEKTCLQEWQRRRDKLGLGEVLSRKSDKLEFGDRRKFEKKKS